MAKNNRDSVEETELIKKIRKRFKLAQSGSEKQYELSRADIDFCSTDNQWDEDVRQSRTGRPTYAADRLNAQVKALTNAQRENRPAITVNAVNSEADEEVAEVLQGIVRHIESDSCADMAYDEAFEWAVRCGIGYWRIRTDLENPEMPYDEKQKVVIESINNPFQVFLDPTYKRMDGSDIEWGFIVETLTEDEFKEAYPDANLSQMSSREWMGQNYQVPDWISGDGKTCVVAEYFVMEHRDTKVHRLDDGRIINDDDIEDTDREHIIDTRKTTKHYVKWYKLNGIEILDETEWLGSYIPIIPVFGDALLENGQRIYSGLVRRCKEEQQMLNVVKTTAIEMLAQMPKTPWIGPKGFAGDNKEDWQDINLVPKAYLEYATIDGSGNPMAAPTRTLAEPPLQGILEVMNSIENDIKATNNMYDPSLGNKMSNDQSGTAIKALQTQGSISNFHFSDNLSRAIRYCGKQLIDLIPKIYDEKRVIRIIGADEKNRLITINGDVPDETTISKDGVPRVYDITVGKYCVDISSGPSYQTQREANRNLLFDIFSKVPQAMPIAADLLFQSLDSPLGHALAERWEKTLPAPLQPQDKGTPNLPPQIQQQLQQQQQMIQQLTQTLQKETELADKVSQDQQTKLQIAQLNSNTEILKHKTQLESDAHTNLLKIEIEQLKAETNKAHDVLMAVHNHMLNKDMVATKAIVGAITTPHNNGSSDSFDGSDSTMDVA